MGRVTDVDDAPASTLVLAMDTLAMHCEDDAVGPLSDAFGARYTACLPICWLGDSEHIERVLPIYL